MQGLWKDQRKHFLKDKSKGVYNRIVRPILRDIDTLTSDIFKRDITVIERTSKTVTSKKLYKILVQSYPTKVYYAYPVRRYGGNNWYMENGTKIKTTWVLEYEGRKTTYDIPVKIIELISETDVKVQYNSYNVYHDSNYFLYGKPFKWSDIRWRGTKRRKYAQKMVNDSNKMYVRGYISKQNWDAEIKQAWGTKSISWIVN